MKYQQILRYLTRRSTGKTTLLQTGVKTYNKPFLFVCKTVERGRFETDNNPNAIYVTDKTQNELQGRDCPIMLNHDIIVNLIDRIHYLELENTILKNRKK